MSTERLAKFLFEIASAERIAMLRALAAGGLRHSEVADRLSAGGTVHQPPAPAFWGGVFAAITDKFDVDWMLNCRPAAGPPP